MGVSEGRLQSELWRGAVPVEVRLAPDEVADVTTPAPLYALVPRAAYLPLWHNEPGGPREHFADALPEASTRTSPWFEHDGLPLRWQLTAGTLFDLLSCARGADPPNELPWRLTVHYRPYGSAAADDAGAASSASRSASSASQFQCGDEDTVRAHFFNALKEATYVVQGSAGGVMSMTRAAQTDLWRSVRTGNRQLAYRAEAELNGSTEEGGGPREGESGKGSGSSEERPHAGGGGGGGGGNRTRRVPLRVYVLDGGDGRRELKAWSDVVCASVPVPAASARTLGDALACAGVAVASGVDEAGGGTRDVRAVVEGVDVSLATGLDVLYAHFKGADHFLHVCVSRF